MGDDLKKNGRRPIKKNWRQPKKKMEDDLKTNKNGRQLLKKEEEKRRRPKQKNRDNLKKNGWRPQKNKIN